MIVQFNSPDPCDTHIKQEQLKHDSSPTGSLPASGLCHTQIHTAVTLVSTSYVDHEWLFFYIEHPSASVTHWCGLQSFTQPCHNPVLDVCLQSFDLIASDTWELKACH